MYLVYLMDHTSDTDYSSTGEPEGILTLYNSSGSDGAGVNNYSSLEFNTASGPSIIAASLFLFILSFFLKNFHPVPSILFLLSLILIMTGLIIKLC